MSGSPVYIDGRLVGAVSYSLGSFPKEPIAGITPIGEMIDATADAGAAPRRVDAGAPRPAVDAGAFRRRRSAAAYARFAPFADRPADVQAFGLPAPPARRSARCSGRLPRRW